MAVVAFAEETSCGGSKMPFHLRTVEDVEIEEYGMMQIQQCVRRIRQCHVRLSLKHTLVRWPSG